MASNSSAAAFEQDLASAEQLLTSDPAAALTRAQRLAAGRPDARAFRLAAAALRALGRSDEAAECEIDAIKFGFTPPLRHAVAAGESGRPRDSLLIATDYLRHHPDDLLAMTIATEAALTLGQASLAEQLLRQVRERAPAFPRAGILLAQCLAGQSRLREAVEVAADLHRRLPEDRVATRYLAELHSQLAEPLEAAALYAELIAVAPDAADLYRYAQSMRIAGRKQESLDALRRVIELEPNSGRAWWTIAQYFPEALEEPDADRIRATIAELGPDAPDSLRLRVALSILHHRNGEFEAAFRHIAEVKSGRRAQMPYDADALGAHVDELLATYSAPRVRDQHSRASASATPIFIVGMPRSGSTLVERILGRHSRIEALGELRIMGALVAVESAPGDTGYRSLVAHALRDGKPAEMAERYLRHSMDFRRTEKPFFTDKFNANWIRSGLILQMFPNARILDIRRGALDCCWSVYKMMFGDAYANDQRDLARYYADYGRFMDAMAELAPDNVLRVDYESLVDDIAAQTQRMLDFIDLDYEPDCVAFHLSDAPVATPSSEQVRRPLFREGIGSAEPYRQWLGPMIEELERRGVTTGRNS
jgi:tetratricopeptide (TPR) repeat protein